MNIKYLHSSEYKEYLDLKELHKILPDDLLIGPLHDRYQELQLKLGFRMSDIAAGIVGVQPMSAPTGKIFTMKPVYSKSDKT